MKNLLKYSFSIMLMISCLIMFSMLSFKVLFTDDKQEIPEAEETEAVDEGEDKDAGDTDKGAETEDGGAAGSGTNAADNGGNGTTAAPTPNAYGEIGNFTTAGAEYFADALFIGDSRTVGMWEYGGISGADFFCDTGMNVYNVYDKAKYIESIGATVNLDSLLKSKTYGKIYLMLGINELGYSMDSITKNYKALVDWIRERAPNSILFLEANLHLAAARSSSDRYFNNPRLDELNKKIAAFADGRKIFYIDVNPVFDDENGNLRAEYTSDNTHPLAKFYPQWRDWLLTRAVV